MRKSKFIHLHILLHTANELYSSGGISDEIYEKLIETIEEDFNKIVKEMETKEISEILENYILGFS
ncbi:hypothetical protein [Ascidiimonas aurantiaca]|uniref:hypothetical protein n=1 Tax=Ascidiimonas aurantiaca TaxID=1685432 RepID=UPI0030EEF725